MGMARKVKADSDAMMALKGIVHELNTKYPKGEISLTLYSKTDVKSFLVLRYKFENAGDAGTYIAKINSILGNETTSSSTASSLANSEEEEESPAKQLTAVAESTLPMPPTPDNIARAVFGPAPDTTLN